MSKFRRLCIPRELDGRRLDEALAALVPGPSRARLQKLVRRGALRRDGRPLQRSNVRVRAGDEYDLHLPGDEAPAAPPHPPHPSHASPRIVFEDDALLVVDKPAGLLTHPAPRSRAGSVSERVGRSHGPLPTTFGPERPGVVHRLDRWTSGLLVLARTDDAMRALKTAFAERRVAKRYLALGRGRLVTTPLCCDEPLAAGRGGSDRQHVGRGPGAKPARTDFEPLEHIGVATLLACRPRTGRRHQIRAHLWWSGLALLGETIYRVPDAPALPDGVPAAPRQALHAVGLAFRHPTTDADLAFESDWPADLAPTLDALRAETR